jgi:hypothetical protein
VEGREAAFNAWVANIPAGLKNSSEMMNSDKIYFTRSRPEGTSNVTKLWTPIPLKEGENLVTVVVKNDLGVTERKLIYVRRDVTAVAETATKTVQNVEPR